MSGATERACSQGKRIAVRGTASKCSMRQGQCLPKCGRALDASGLPTPLCMEGHSRACCTPSLLQLTRGAHAADLDVPNWDAVPAGYAWCGCTLSCAAVAALVNWENQLGACRHNGQVGVHLGCVHAALHRQRQGRVSSLRGGREGSKSYTHAPSCMRPSGCWPTPCDVRTFFAAFKLRACVRAWVACLLKGGCPVGCHHRAPLPHPDTIPLLCPPEESELRKMLRDSHKHSQPSSLLAPLPGLPTLAPASLHTPDLCRPRA